MPITKATQNVITPSIVTTDTRQTITSEKVIQCLYDTTSTTSLTIGTGSKTLTVGTGLSWVAGRVATIRNGTYTTRFMTGSVTSYDSTTGVMVVNVTTVGTGTGTFASWNVTQDSSTALPALRITSNDSGNAFVVEDSTNPDSSPTVITNSGNLILGGTSMPPGMASKLYANNQTYINYQNFKYSSTSSGLVSGRGAINLYNLNPTGISGTELDYRSVSPYYFSSNTDPVVNVDLINELDFAFTDYNYSYMKDPRNSVLLEVRILVNISQYTIATGNILYQRGAYSGNVVVGLYGSSSWNNITPDFIGYTANSLSTTQPGTGTTTQVNFTTAAGIAPTLGGAPATGFASIIAIRETSSSDGSLTLQIRPHTTANTTSISYISYIAVFIKMLIL